MSINYHHKYNSSDFYHVYNHSASNKNIFFDRYDYEDFLIKHFKYFDSIFDTIAYCLMPNHYHLLVRVKELDTIVNNIKKDVDSKIKEQFIFNEKCINDLIEDRYRRMFSAYVMKYNKKHSTSGQLFLKKHKRIYLDPESRLQYILCYIHHNPIHHNFKKEYNDWPYSSFLRYLENDEMFIKYLDLFGGIENFKLLHENFKVDKFNDSINIDLLNFIN